MKKYIFTLFALFGIFVSGNLLAQSLTASPATITQPTSGTVSVTLTRSGSWGSSGNYSLTTSSATGISTPASFPFSWSSGTTSTTVTFTTAAIGTYTFTLTRNGVSQQATVVVEAPAPIGCNGQYYVSYGSFNSSTSTTSMSKLNFAGSTISTSSFTTNPTGIGFNAIGINPLDGFMYGVRYSPMSLIRVSANASGNVVNLGTITNASISSGDNAYAGCFDSDGTFYFLTDADEFYKISGINSPAAPLAATFIRTMSDAVDFFVDIAIDPTDGQMYGVAGIGSNNKTLYKINKTNGTLTVVGTYSGSNYIASLFFDEVGNLFGYRQDGTFQQINKGTAGQVQVGTAPSYTYADGCSCSFGRVFHDLDFTANPGNQLCPTIANPNPTFPLVVTVTNQSSSQKTGLTYTLNISDIKKRFRFTESAATIKANLVSAGLATAASTVTLTAEAPASGTNYNKIVVTGFQTGGVNAVNSFTVLVQLYTLGGVYDPVPLQSVISGLPAIIGGSDLSNDPGTISPDDATVISFCPGITLPVEFKSFTAVRNRSNVLLTWETSMEKNNSGFAVERNINGNWQQIAWVPSQALGGNSDAPLVYTLSDLNNIKGVSQYRIRQVDFDAKSKYSEVRSVRGDGQLGQTIVYPNPTNNGKVNIIFEEGSLKRDISVFDMSGREIQQMKAVTTNNITIENLTPGMYMVRIIAVETGEQVVEKVVVNKR
ncbi:MAG TPA: T9SS type A sorting domain-containing protein [Chitinophagaceae bacterium]|nr:T9SS type A sorting domain-containing protein [Chitinophagaceae bacterium]